MDYEFSRYDDDNGRLKVEGISHSFPMVSQRYFVGDGMAVLSDTKMNPAFFVASGYTIEDGGKTYRIWKLTPQGRELVKQSKAA
jgi:hypothetical protein